MEFTSHCYKNCIAGTFSRLLDMHGFDNKEEIMRKIHKYVQTFDDGLNPGFVYTAVYKQFRSLTGMDDPCYLLKKEENEQGLKAVDVIQNIIAGSSQRMLDITKASAAGNLIDVSFGNTFEVEHEIRLKLSEDFSIDHSELFHRSLLEADSIVILADNAGEIIIDRLFAQKIHRWRKLHGKRPTDIIVFVKAVPVINDAMLEDAAAAKFDEIARVYDTGCEYIGTPFEYVSDFTKNALIEADVIIAKGLGNYESLYYQRHLQKKIFYLMKAKCQIVADMLHVPINSLVCVNGSNLCF